MNVCHNAEDNEKNLIHGKKNEFLSVNVLSKNEYTYSKSWAWSYLLKNFQRKN